MRYQKTFKKINRIARRKLDNPRYKLTRLISNRSFMVLAGTYVFVVTNIIRQASIPLWYDEVWRARSISLTWHIPPPHAPISFGVFLITKLLTLVFNNNFTQRSVAYLALILLPITIYKFCTKFFDHTTAQLAVILVVFSAPFLQHAIENKPYIMDVVCSLWIIYLFADFLAKRISAKRLIVVSTILSLMSFTSVFVAISLGAYSLVKYWFAKGADKLNLKRLLTWAGITLISLLHILIYVKPQVSPGINPYWDGLYLKGGFASIATKTTENVLSIFGIIPRASFLQTVGLNSGPILWTSSELFSTSQLAPVIGMSFLILSLWACYKLWQNKKPLIPVVIVTSLILQWFGALFEKWPFGNNRTNLFCNTLILLVLCYGIKLVVINAIKHRQQLSLVVVVSLLFVIFPFKSVKNVVFRPRKGSVMSGVQPASVYIAKHSGPDDWVLVYHFMEKQPFDYYYNYSDYTSGHPSRTRHIVYEDQKVHISHDPSLFKTINPKTLWMIMYPANKYSPVQTAQQAGYKLVKSVWYPGHVLMAQLKRH